MWRHTLTHSGIHWDALPQTTLHRNYQQHGAKIIYNINTEGARIIYQQHWLLRFNLRVDQTIRLPQKSGQFEKLLKKSNLIWGWGVMRQAELSNLSVFSFVFFLVIRSEDVRTSLLVINFKDAMFSISAPWSEHVNAEAPAG